MQEVSRYKRIETEIEGLRQLYKGSEPREIPIDAISKMMAWNLKPHPMITAMDITRDNHDAEKARIKESKELKDIFKRVVDFISGGDARPVVTDKAMRQAEEQSLETFDTYYRKISAGLWQSQQIDNRLAMDRAIVRSHAKPPRNG